ncbi:S8 family serine peptidase [Thalassovita sp.]|uniref:S8 family serine peptidase n=1 Tax=Thalassovita sp. TaxID=1979401 RepID=UPI002B26BB80|nr:S8 family serine peptidase [Thalassovita sp.]
MGDTFSRLDDAFRGENADVLLRQDPAGIAPERALVFESLLPIQNFQKAAAKAGFELLIEDRLGDDHEIPDEMIDDYAENAAPTLYATMPSTAELEKLLSLWRSYQAQEKAELGYAPWWNLFAMLSDVRVWGPQDRLTAEVRDELAYRLDQDDESPLRLELEIWPTANASLRARWQRETQAKIVGLGGRILATSAIDEADFIYQAVLAEMPNASVRAMLDNPMAPEGIATLDGLQFILPQMVAQSLPDKSGTQHVLEDVPLEPFDGNAPFRVVLLDGTPIAAHPALNDGVIIEDVHELVPLSQVEHRRHATSMASLILRGDLKADGVPVPDTRLLAIPILVDDENGASSPNDRLFVDLVHVALARAFLGDDALAPEAHLVNFSVGIRNAHFAGKIGSLARLLDWWSERHGLLFMVAAGNVPASLTIPGTTYMNFEDAEPAERRMLVETALKENRHTRTLMAPAEAMNVLTVGASSQDLTEPAAPSPAGTIALHNNGQVFPALSSAIGLGAFRSIKPDFLATAGEHELRVSSAGSAGVALRVIDKTQRTGLHVASVQRGVAGSYRTRGTSCANALASRAGLFSIASLMESDGPYADTPLTPRDKALLTKALSINASAWPETAVTRFAQECAPNPRQHARAREEVSRYYGHGLLDSIRMREAPPTGATLVGLGTLRKDKAAIFQVPLPPSLSGERIGRSMLATIAWFSPVRPTRARYRLAALDAVAHGYDMFGELIPDDGWALAMKSDQLDKNLIGRGTVWSRRLIHNAATVPSFGEGLDLPIRVQCRDSSGGGLSPDDDIPFALVVTIEVESGASFDIHQEIEEKLRVGVRSEE